MALPYREMDALCADVRLRRRDAPLADLGAEVETPEGATLWEGTYAAVLLWPCVEDGLDDAAIDGQSWLDELLSKRETRDRPIDGYLVLALAEPPSAGAEGGTVARVQASTQVCRKQVIWPAEAGGTEWSGLAGVSVLGFPASVAAGEVDSWPVMDPEATALWARIEENGHVRAADEDRRGGGA